MSLGAVRGWPAVVGIVRTIRPKPSRQRSKVLIINTDIKPVPRFKHMVVESNKLREENLICMTIPVLRHKEKMSELYQFCV